MITTVRLFMIGPWIVNKPQPKSTSSSTERKWKIDAICIWVDGSIYWIIFARRENLGKQMRCAARIIGTLCFLNHMLSMMTCPLGVESWLVLGAWLEPGMNLLSAMSRTCYDLNASSFIALAESAWHIWHVLRLGFLWPGCVHSLYLVCLACRWCFSR